MNRRSFLRTFGLFVFVFLILPTSWLMSGCTGDTIKGILNTVLASAKALLGLIAPNSSLYADFSAAIAKLEADEAQWTAGGVITLIEDGLTAVEDVLAVIPVTAIYSPLIAILVAGIEAVLALIPRPTPAASAAALTAMVQRVQTNPYIGQATLDQPSFWHPTHAGAYTDQWNKKAVAIRLAQAKIQ